MNRDELHVFWYDLQRLAKGNVRNVKRDTDAQLARLFTEIVTRDVTSSQLAYELQSIKQKHETRGYRYEVNPDAVISEYISLICEVLEKELSKYRQYEEDWKHLLDQTQLENTWAQALVEQTVKHALSDKERKGYS